MVNTVIRFKNTPSPSPIFSLSVVCPARQSTERLGQAKGFEMENLSFNYSISLEKKRNDVKSPFIYAKPKSQARTLPTVMNYLAMIEKCCLLEALIYYLPYLNGWKTKGDMMHKECVK